MLFASTSAWIRVSSGISGQMLNREGKKVKLLPLCVVRFCSFCNISGSDGADKLTNTSWPFNIPSPDDQAEETRTLRAPLFSGLCVHKLRGSTCRAVSDKVGGYQSSRLWATLSTHWRVQPAWKHFTAARFLWEYSSDVQISVLLPVGGVFWVQVNHQFEHILTLFMVHDTCVCIKHYSKSLRINQEIVLTLHRPLIFHRIWNLPQRVLI